MRERGWSAEREKFERVRRKKGVKDDGVKQGVKHGMKLEASSRGGSSMRMRMKQAIMEHINVN